MLSDDVERDGVDAERRIVIAGCLDRHAVEALRLEVERFARRAGIALTVRVERASEPRASA